MHTIRQTLAADWGPSLESAVRQLAAVLVAAYVAGYCLGAFVHRLSAALAAWASKPHRLTVKPATAIATATATAIATATATATATAARPVSIKAAAWLQAGGLSSREIAEILKTA